MAEVNFENRTYTFLERDSQSICTIITDVPSGGSEVNVTARVSLVDGLANGKKLTLVMAFNAKSILFDFLLYIYIYISSLV